MNTGERLVVVGALRVLTCKFALLLEHLELGSRETALTITLGMGGVDVDEENDEERDEDDHDDPEDRDVGVAAHPLEIDGDGHGLGDTRVVAGAEERRAELAHRTGKRKHRTCGDGGPGVGNHKTVEDAALRPSQRTSGVEHVGIERLECAAGRAVHERERHHRSRDDCGGPGEHELHAMLHEPLTDWRGVAEQ